ncbi:MAG: hypothetical protein ACOYT4_00650 [Nanoarchaeota archaeon]
MGKKLAILSIGALAFLAFSMHEPNLEKKPLNKGYNTINYMTKHNTQRTAKLEGTVMDIEKYPYLIHSKNNKQNLESADVLHIEAKDGEDYIIISKKHFQIGQGIKIDYYPLDNSREQYKIPDSDLIIIANGVAQ